MSALKHRQFLGLSWVNDDLSRVRNHDTGEIVAVLTQRQWTAFILCCQAALQARNGTSSAIPLQNWLEAFEAGSSSAQSSGSWQMYPLSVQQQETALKRLLGIPQTHALFPLAQSGYSEARSHSASSSPGSISDNARTDSTSDAGTKNVAPIDLSGESLHTLRRLAEHAQNPTLLRAATLELNKRRGDV